uniref:Uncharacterized protein n=1 Tax=Branchiostoma floridae TaxID=7739 RepID=C3XYA6_BRAFL|eukprot:XP_002610781.1 hypothetical protein BRAFLDRAFT_91573 [Branchiostoma floridae]
MPWVVQSRRPAGDGLVGSLKRFTSASSSMRTTWRKAGLSWSRPERRGGVVHLSSVRGRTEEVALDGGFSCQVLPSCTRGAQVPRYHSSTLILSTVAALDVVSGVVAKERKSANKAPSRAAAAHCRPSGGVASDGSFGAACRRSRASHLGFHE